MTYIERKSFITDFVNCPKLEKSEPYLTKPRKIAVSIEMLIICDIRHLAFNKSVTTR